MDHGEGKGSETIEAELMESGSQETKAEWWKRPGALLTWRVMGFEAVARTRVSRVSESILHFLRFLVPLLPRITSRQQSK